MRRSHRYWSLVGQVLLAVVCAGLTVESALAQFGAGVQTTAAEEGNEDKGAVNEIRTFSLKHADANFVSRNLAPNFRDGRTNIFADPRTNSVYVSAPPAAFVQIEQMVHEMDRPGLTKTVRVYNLQHASATSLAAMLQSLQLKGDLNFAVDRENNRIIVSTDDATHQSVVDLLKHLDVPSSREHDGKDGPGSPGQAVRVRAIWFISGGDTDAMPKPTKDLQPVTDELSALGLEGLRLVGQSIVSTMPPGRFSLDGTPVIRQGDAQRPSQWQISGSLMPPAEAVNSQFFEIELKAEVAASAPSDSSKPAGVNLGNLKTQLMVPYGHFVVLGTVPFEDMTSVFVIQLTRIEPVSGEAPNAGQK